jgi:uncharacterized membrane protein YGL010W
MGSMTILNEWADRYGALRARGAGSASAWVGIPLVTLSLIGLLWSLPVPQPFREASPAINYATLFIMATFVYYCILSVSLALVSLVLMLAATAPSVWLTAAGLPLLPIAAVVFAASFGWQLLETRRATGRMLVIANLQYLMLGPIWLLRAAYRSLGLRYDGSRE